MKAMTLMLSVSLVAIPGAVAAQARVDAGAAATGQVTTRHEGSSQAAVGGEAALQATAEARLPVAPVHRVIAEGRARGASAAQIDGAALAVHSRLHAAAEAIHDERRPAPSHAEIEAGAEAIAAGAAPGDLERIADAAPSDRSLTASLTALAQLTAEGGDAARVAADLAGRLQAGASDDAIASLAGGANGAAGIGGAAVDAAAGVTGTVRAGTGAIGVAGSVIGSVGGGIIR